MRRMNLYEKIISEDNLICAWDRVRYDSKDDFAPDCFEYLDIGYNIEDLIKFIHNRLAMDNYIAHPLKFIDIPKSTLAVRPGSVPEIEDRIVSYAILNVIAPEIDKQLSKNVYSFRIKKDSRKKCKKDFFVKRKEHPFLKQKMLKDKALIKEWFYDWPEFYNISKTLFEQEGYNLLTISDVASYFENIEHKLLRDLLLRMLPQQYKVVNLLMDILEKWVWRSGSLRHINRGIPQGNDVSSFLGNIFLMPLDDIFKDYSRKEDIKYIRYMDDIKIFSKSEKVARECLFVINNTLRDLHLNVQGYKNQILHESEIQEELFPKCMDRINEKINSLYDLKKNKILNEKKRTEFNEFFVSQLNSLGENSNWDKNDLRCFSRMITGLKVIKNKSAVNVCLNELKRNPDARINNKIIKYFMLFYDDKKINQKVSEFLLSDVNIFWYQESHLFLLIKYFDIIQEELRHYMYNIAIDKKNHWFNRSSALIALSSERLDPAILNNLKELYKKESNTDVKRSIALCLAQLDKNNLQSFIKIMKNDLDIHIKTVGNYYEKVIFNEDKIPEKLISDLEKHINSSYFIDKFYLLYLVSNVDKDHIKKRFVNLLGISYKRIDNIKFKKQINYIHQKITTINLAERVDL